MYAQMILIYLPKHATSHVHKRVSPDLGMTCSESGDTFLWAYLSIGHYHMATVHTAAVCINAKS